MNETTSGKRMTWRVYGCLSFNSRRWRLFAFRIFSELTLISEQKDTAMRQTVTSMRPAVTERPRDDLPSLISLFALHSLELHCHHFRKFFANFLIDCMRAVPRNTFHCRLLLELSLLSGHRDLTALVGPISPNHPGQLSLLPSAGLEMSTSQRSVTLCVCGVKAGHSACGYKRVGDR